MKKWISPGRTAALKRLALDLGMEFEENDAMHDLALLRHFRCYRQTNRSRKVFHVLKKKHALLDHVLQVFDLRWTVSTGKSSRTFYQTMFFIRSQSLALPDFYLRPEHFLHRIGAWLGMQDIDFVEYPEFSHHNVLKGEDEDLVRQLVVKPQLAGMFRLNREWFVEGLGYYLVLYKQRRLLTPEEIKDLITRGVELYQMLRTEESVALPDPDPGSRPEVGPGSLSV